MKKIIISLILILSIPIYSQSIKLEQEVVYKGDFIGSIGQVALDSKGQIYIGDLINGNIHLFSPSGKYIKQIGRKGNGPGEFQYIWGLQVIEKDSIYVLDGGLNRITVFAPDQFDYPAYTIKVIGGPNGEAITTVGLQNGGTNGLWMYKNNIFVSYQMYYSNENLNKLHYLKIYRLNHKGKIADKTPLVNIRGMDRLITQGKGFMISNMPFGQVPIIQLGSEGYFYFGNSDDFNIKSVDLTGKIVRELKYKEKPIRIRATMWEEVIKKNEYLTREMLKNSLTPLPEYKRVFEDFVIDDNGMIWVAVNTKSTKNYTWMIFDQKNKLITKFKFPKSVILKIVKKNYAYGIYTDDMGFQSIVKYKINK